MSAQTQPVPASRPKRVLGMTGQVAGVVGVVICALLIIALLFARAWAGDRIDETAASIDASLAKGVPLLEAAAANVDAVSAQIVGVAEAAEAVAARPNPAPALVEALSSRLAGLSESYLELRTTYADARETIVGAIDRLLLLERLIPPFTVPREPLEALAAADARVREMDARVQEILAAPGAGAVREVASAVAETARGVESGLADVSAGIDDASTQLADVRAEIAETADTANLAITVLSVALILGLLYSALLHVVLFRSAREIRRR